jgi:hypothetical protein
MDITAFGKTQPLEKHLWEIANTRRDEFHKDVINLMLAAYSVIESQKIFIQQGDEREARINTQLTAKLDQLLSRVDQPRWLVQGTVSVSHYMQDGREQRVETLVVLADTEQEACDKFVAHWESKTSEYAVYYTAWADKAYQTS